MPPSGTSRFKDDLQRAVAVASALATGHVRIYIIAQLSGSLGANNAERTMPSHFDFWCELLGDEGFEGSEAKKRELAQFLVENEITKLTHLQFADHPRTWRGSGEFEAAELEAVWKLRRAARRRSRCAVHMN